MSMHGGYMSTNLKCGTLRRTRAYETGERIITIHVDLLFLFGVGHEELQATISSQAIVPATSFSSRQ